MHYLPELVHYLLIQTISRLNCLYCQPNKHEFYAQELPYLGHLLTTRSVKPDPPWASALFCDISEVNMGLILTRTGWHFGCLQWVPHRHCPSALSALPMVWAVTQTCARWSPAYRTFATFGGACRCAATPERCTTLSLPIPRQSSGTNAKSGI
jgi:hypothetical protein